METLTPVFQTDSAEVNEVYQQNPNYLIEYAQPVAETPQPYCILYFSSHDIYYPNTPTAFQTQLVAKNKFEWYGTRVNKGTKHIFLRDVKKQWYLTGVNAQLNTVEKMLGFLKTETEGYRVITIGSSAGGYAAVLFGQLLNAETIFTFNGQFMLSDLLESSTEVLNPIVFRENLNPTINQYYSLKQFITAPQTIFYFYSRKSPWDVLQNSHVKGFGLNRIGFNTAHHGIPFLKIALAKVVNLPHKTLLKQRQNQNPFWFSIQHAGFMACTIFLLNEIIRLTLNKLSNLKR